MNYAYPQPKLPPVSIPPANDGWPFQPTILTDHVLTQLRAKVYDRKEIEQRPINLIVSALGFMSASMQQHMPMVGEVFNNTIRELGQCVGNLYLNEYSTLDYLSGKGPLGSYIADNIEMFKLCGEVHRIEGEYIRQSVVQVDMEAEYRQIFNYEPKTISVNGKLCDEYDYLTRLVKRIHEFGYITKAYSNNDYKDLFCDNSLNMDTGEFQFNYGTADKSGIYNRNSGFGHTRSLLVLIAPLRDTKVALVFDLFNQGSSLQRLYYKHRAENVWIKSSDYSGTWILDGTYEALYKEAETFMAKMGCQLDPALQPHADNCLTHLKRIDEVMTALADVGCANAITDVFKEFELTNKELGNFSLKHNGVKYTYCKLLTENPEYRLNIEKILSTSSFQNGNFHDTVIYGEEVKTHLVDSFTTTCYFVEELAKYLDSSMAKLERLYQLSLLPPTETLPEE